MSYGVTRYGSAGHHVMIFLCENSILGVTFLNLEIHLAEITFQAISYVNRCLFPGAGCKIRCQAVLFEILANVTARKIGAEVLSEIFSTLSVS